MNINIPDDLFEDLNSALQKRGLNDIEYFLKTQIEISLSRFLYPGYEIDHLTNCKTYNQLLHDIDIHLISSGWNDHSIWTNKYLCIDIDQFHNYIDKYGFHPGDNMLINISNQLKNLYPERNIYRHGGDSFIIELDNDKIIKPNISEIKLKYTILNLSIARQQNHMQFIHQSIEYYFAKAINDSSIHITKLKYIAT